MRRTRLQTRGEVNDDALFHRLPNELLRHVFELSLPIVPHWTDIGSSRKDEMRHLVILTSVCRIWREVCLATAVLWTFIFAHAPMARGRTKEYWKIHIARIRAQVARSKTAKLKITLLLDKTHPAVVSTIVEILTPHLHRCIALKIVRHTGQLQETFFPLLLDQMQSLKELRVEGKSILFPQGLRLSPQDEGEGHRQVVLEKLVLYGIDSVVLRDGLFLPPDVLVNLNSLNWSTHSHAHAPSQDSADTRIVYDFLKRFSTLRILRLGVATEIAPSDPIELPALEILILKSLSACRLLSILSAPLLHFLGLDLSRVPGGTEIDWGLEQLSDKFPRLHVASISASTMVVYQQVFHSLDGVDFLTISEPECDYTVARQLGHQYPGSREHTPDPDDAREMLRRTAQDRYKDDLMPKLRILLLHQRYYKIRTTAEDDERKGYSECINCVLLTRSNVSVIYMMEHGADVLSPVVNELVKDRLVILRLPPGASFDVGPDINLPLDTR